MESPTSPVPRTRRKFSAIHTFQTNNDILITLYEAPNYIVWKHYTVELREPENNPSQP